MKAAQLPPASDYSTGWVTTRIPLSREVSNLAYHPSSSTYILSTLSQSPFILPTDDESLRIQSPENDSFSPIIDRSTLQLFDRSTNTTVDSHSFDTYEIITALAVISLCPSEHSPEARQDFVCVGTSLIRGEDLLALGRIYIFAIIDVVPEPEHPETGRAFKLVSKEEVRGAVTALSAVGTQGFLLMAQGQKCMVRGLKEDGSILPVAFMDMQTHVTTAKALPGTGLCLMGDALKGVWFCGYTVCHTL